MNPSLRRKLWITGVILVVVLAILCGFLPRTQEVDLVRLLRGRSGDNLARRGRTRRIMFT